MKNKGVFLKLLAALEDQYRNDQLKQKKLEKVYGDDAQIPMHNVDALVVPVVEIMADMVLMASGEAEEQIFNFMYACNFGKAIHSNGNELWYMLNEIDTSKTYYIPNTYEEDEPLTLCNCKNAIRYFACVDGCEKGFKPPKIDLS